MLQMSVWTWGQLPSAPVNAPSQLTSNRPLDASTAQLVPLQPSDAADLHGHFDGIMGRHQHLKVEFARLPLRLARFHCVSNGQNHEPTGAGGSGRWRD